MRECLITNEVCSEQNRKCKICFLDDCRRTLEMLEIQERNIKKEEERRIRKQLPKECKHCCFLETRNEGVYCFYRYNGRCALK